MPGTTALVVPPNWSDAVVERYAWLTDVQVTRDGTEERLPLREAPRRTVRYRMLRDGPRARQLDADAWGWRGTADLDVPIWQDAQQLAAALPAASASIPCSTEGRDFRSTGKAVLTDGTRHELVTVSTVGDDSLTLAADTTLDWPAGTRLVPVRSGRLLGVGRTHHSTSLLEGEIELELTDLGDTIEPAGSGSTYRTRDLDTRRPDWTGGLGGQFVRDTDRIDSDTGVWVTQDNLGRPVAVRTLGYLLHGRDDIRAMLAWLHQRAGRAVGFWCPTWTADLEITSSIELEETAIYVRSISYADRYALRQGRLDLALWHKPTRTLHCRRILAVDDIEGGDEELTLDASLPVEGAPTDWVVSWLEYVRLDADEIEIAYLTAETARVQLTVREIVVEEEIPAEPEE